MAQLDTLEDWVAPLLAKLTPAARRSLALAVARDLRRSQAARIAAQRNPDGSRFEPRRKPRAAAAKNIRFIYRKPNGQAREAELRSFRNQGGAVIGFDIEANDIRTFIKKRIVRNLPPQHSPIRARVGAVRQRMFDAIKTSPHLKAQGSASEATVGFFGRTARIAQVHQLGLRDRVERNGPEHLYPKRELLGFTLADEQLVRARLLQHLTERG